MNDSKYVLLTFDYEMFLGQSGTIDNCLIRPTDELIRILEKKSAKATFFVDTTFLLVLRKNNHNTEFDKIKRQLIQLLSHGHRIELHIHPHWLDSIYNELTGQWEFIDFRYYQHKNTPSELFRELFLDGFELLKEIAQEIDPDYRPQAFRAGGWCVEPFENLIELFRKTGIWIDSSVLPTISTNGKIVNYDFSSIHRLTPYFFNRTVHELLEGGEFIEIPLSVVKVGFFDRVLRKFQIKINPQYYSYFGDGNLIFTSQVQGKQNNFRDLLKSKLFSSPEVLNIDGAASLRKIISGIWKNEISTIVGHPKLLTENSFNCLDKIIDFPKVKFVDVCELAYYQKVRHEK